MTVGVAWISRRRDWSELWVATDSRLSGDGVWDECPKLVPLSRRDSVAAFSGATAQAYPLLLQIRHAIDGYAPARDGTLEFHGLMAHLERVVNSVMQSLTPDPLVRPEGLDLPPAFSGRGDVVLVAGYSRSNNDLVIRALQTRGGPGTPWVFTKVRDRKTFGPNKKFRVFGDRTAAGLYWHYLRQRLIDCGKYGTSEPFSYEPLEALWEILDQARRGLHRRALRSVGGAPQVVGIIPGGTATPFAVRWPSPSGPDEYLYGRRCLDYERLDVPLIEHSNGVLSIRAPGEWTRSATVRRTEPDASWRGFFQRLAGRF